METLTPENQNSHLNREAALPKLMNQTIEQIEKAMLELLPDAPESTAKAALRDKLQADGTTEPLTLWRETGALVDGFIRRDLCRELGLTYQTTERSFPSLSDALAWRLEQNVTSRRHLNAYQRCVAALKLKDHYAKLAKANQRLSKGRGQKGRADLPHLKTSQILAHVAQVSETQLKQVFRVLRNADRFLPSAKAKEALTLLDKGEKTISSVLSDVVRAQTAAKRAEKEISQQPVEAFENTHEWENQIICLDVLEGLARIPDDSVTLIVTSPPYLGAGFDYDGVFNDAADVAVHLEWLANIWQECSKVLRSGGRLCLNIDNMRTASGLQDIRTDICLQMRSVPGLIFDGDIVWHKANKPARKMGHKVKLRSNCEYILVFYKGQKELPQLGKWGSDITQAEQAEYSQTLWNIATNRAKIPHPCPFPEEIPARCIKLFSNPEDMVLDIFNGSGTTTAMAAKHNRRYCGIDVNPSYCQYASERVAKFSAKSCSPIAL